MNDTNQQPEVKRGRGRGESRTERVPLGVHRTKLSFPEHAKDSNYVYRVVNDDGAGRLDQAIAGGYEFVTNPGAKLGEDSTDGNSDLGSRVSRAVGTKANGDAMRGYLMRIPKDWHAEDQATKQAKVDEIDKSIKSGKAHLSGDDKRYVPDSGINIRTAKVRPVSE